MKTEVTQVCLNSVSLGVSFSLDQFSLVLKAFPQEQFPTPGINSSERNKNHDSLICAKKWSSHWWKVSLTAGEKIGRPEGCTQGRRHCSCTSIHSLEGASHCKRAASRGGPRLLTSRTALPWSAESPYTARPRCLEPWPRAQRGLLALSSLDDLHALSLLYFSFWKGFQSSPL